MLLTRLFVIVMFFTLAGASFTEISRAEDTLESLRSEIETLKERIAELEAEKAARPAVPDHDPFSGPPGGQWDPFDEILRMQEEMDRMFDSSFQRRGAAGAGMFNSNMSYDGEFNVEETDKGYVLKVDIAGLDKDKLDIQINKHSITITGQSSEQTAQEGPRGAFHRQSFGSFLKTIPLPLDADTDAAKIDKTGDLLTINIPKKP